MAGPAIFVDLKGYSMENETFLPVGIQVFEQMITGNFLYVDKTRYIYEMIRPPQGFYFLTRPRRFGKSLTVTTLASLFKGHRDLFQNLWISQTNWDFQPHPVVLLDFSRIDYSSPENLKQSLISRIHQLSSENGLENRLTELPDCHATFLTQLAAKYNTRVVFLVDEYDKPLIEHLGKGEAALAIAKENRDILKQFFGVLKSSDVASILRFVFITGISKFAHVSIFSDLNNLDDISMQESYDAVLGYTQEELLLNFGDRIKQLALRDKRSISDMLSDIRLWYNGYRFTDSKTCVYNPFSIVKFLKDGKFKGHWFETATPAFLANLIQEKNYPVPVIENLELREEDIRIYELENLSVEPLLFQTGYITIKDIEHNLYRMDYPNQEVKTSFLSYLFQHFTPMRDRGTATSYKKLHLYLEQKQVDVFIANVKTIMAAIPYTQIANQGEAYYHTVFYMILSASGATVQTEVLSSIGRLDIIVEFSDLLYIIELKCDQNSEIAIKQIIEKRYYEKYMSGDKSIYLIGINFDSQKRTIGDWKWGRLREFVDM